MKTDREQLLELREHLSEAAGYKHEWVSLIDRLLARWPYEPDELIEVSRCEFTLPGIKARFICGHEHWVWAVPEGCNEAELWGWHRPIPKFRKLEVPEEIIEMAHEVRGELIDASNNSKFAKIIECLVREAGT